MKVDDVGLHVDRVSGPSHAHDAHVGDGASVERDGERAARRALAERHHFDAVKQGSYFVSEKTDGVR